jgi:hypothetical protein
MIDSWLHVKINKIKIIKNKDQSIPGYDALLMAK